MSHSLCQRLLLSAAVLVCLASVPLSQAHNRSQSYSSWDVSGASVELLFTVKSWEVTRLPALEDGLLTPAALLSVHLGKTVRVLADDGASCARAGAPQALAASRGYQRARLLFHCGASPPATLIVDSFFEVAPSHVHYARLRINGEAGDEHLFVDSRRELPIATAAGVGEGTFARFLQYLVLGVEHIISGLDHLAFLAALLLLVRGLRELLWIVSGFTVGHSLTLSLAVLGHINLQMWVIEALIGFTIALVAADNIGVISARRGTIAAMAAASLLLMAGVSLVWGVGLPFLTLAGLVIFTIAYMRVPITDARGGVLRAALTLAFGLVHGFGFASVLSEVGLPQERLAVALAGFNVGVELGQLAVVIPLWLGVGWLSRRPAGSDLQQGFDTASAALCGLGVFWFVSRGFAPM